MAETAAVRPVRFIERLGSAMSLFSWKTPPPPPPEHLSTSVHGPAPTTAAVNLLDLMADALTASLRSAPGAQLPLQPQPSVQAKGLIVPPNAIGNGLDLGSLYLRALALLPTSLRAIVEQYDARVVVAVLVLAVSLLGSFVLGPLLFALRLLAFLYVSYASFYALALSQFGQDDALRPAALVAYLVLEIYLIKQLL